MGEISGLCSYFSCSHLFLVGLWISRGSTQVVVDVVDMIASMILGPEQSCCIYNHRMMTSDQLSFPLDDSVTDCAYLVQPVPTHLAHVVFTVSPRRPTICHTLWARYVPSSMHGG
jgi:hypothetical protein